MKMYHVSHADAENQVAIERGIGKQVQIVNGQAIEMIWYCQANSHGSSFKILSKGSRKVINKL